MKRFTLTGAVLSAVLLIFAAGCAPKTENKVDEQQTVKLAPAQVVEKLFSSLQSSQPEALNDLFASELSGRFSRKFYSEFTSDKSLGLFKAMLLNSDGKTASVKVIYNYLKKAPKTGELGDKKIIDRRFMELVKEKGYWKIRRTGYELFDEEVEKNLFLKCLNTVMDITIAEEKIRQGRDTYSNSLATLLKVYPVNEKECKSILINNANDKSYLVTAVTRNYEPCTITGNTDVHSPERFEECGTTGR
ncbi:MAG TPA: hypothetical protein PLQ76_05995 [bacterium]|nr:hypothetical protein [bacterium]